MLDSHTKHKTEDLQTHLQSRFSGIQDDNYNIDTLKRKKRIKMKR